MWDNSWPIKQIKCWQNNLFVGKKNETAMWRIIFKRNISVFICYFFFYYSKPFNFQYLAGGLIVVLGIYLNVASKNRIDLKLMYYGRLWCPKGIFTKHGKLTTATNV